MTKKKSGIVFSTNPDYIYNNIPDVNASITPANQDLRVWLEKRAGGKSATIVKGFRGPAAKLEELTRKLKNKCSVGGSAKEGEIILQGDQREKVLQLLIKDGYKAKKAGS
jgi:translation initiation factor 1